MTKPHRLPARRRDRARGDGGGRARARRAAARPRRWRSTPSAAPRSTRSATRFPPRRSPRAARPTPCCSARSAGRSGTAPRCGPRRADRAAPRARRLRQPPARRLARGVDLLIVRELVGGLYYGARGTRDDGTVFDTCEYHPSRSSASRGARSSSPAVAADRLLSVDKANVLDDVAHVARASSPRWRPTTPDVELRHGLVDSVAMQIVTHPESSTCS